MKAKSPRDNFVWILVGAHKETPGFWVNCFSKSRTGAVAKSAQYAGQLQPAPIQCLWTVYRAKCPVVDDMVDFAISGEGDTEVSGFRIPYRNADQTRREIVVCQSRLFAYDKWQLMFAVIELYRFYGADMIAAYVDSVISEAFQFLTVYKEQGFVAIHPAVRYEEIGRLDYDPNKETEYYQQISAYNLCLLEYRESTDFLIFGDWDEVLVPRNASTLFEELSIMLAEYPKAAAFRYQRMHVQNYLPKQASFFDLGDFLNSTRSMDKFGASKVVAVGDRVESVGIHRIAWANAPFEEVMLTTEYSMFLHFRERGKRTCDNEEVAGLLPTLNTTELAENFTQFVDDHNLYPTYVNLPTDLVHADSLLECYWNLSQTLGHPEWGICPNHLYCPRPKLPYPVQCTYMKLDFARFKFKEDIVMSYPKRTSFEVRWDGCL
uniref:Glycosyltransferase family 92 protein n=1 Tax=Steinernema glaseri TaxID=37863 RepID=A0A1I7XZ34_9BILA